MIPNYIQTSQGKIILIQLEKQGLSKREMQSFVVECIQNEQGFQLHHDANGKPFLMGENAPNISISYASNWFAIYFSQTKPVGIDIEFATNQVQKITDYFVNDSEKSRFSTLSNDLLQVIWGAKEAVFKFYGGDFKDLKNEVEVILVDFENQNVSTASKFGILNCKFKMLENQLVLVYC